MFVPTEEKETFVMPDILPFGKHHGTPITHVEPGYLRWLSKRAEPFIFQGKNWSKLAEEELNRRGGAYDAVMPSHHAIDRFSTHFLDKWSDRTQGISAFLATLATIAWNEGEVIGTQRPTDYELVRLVGYDGICFVFACNIEGEPLGVKTVQPLKTRK